MWKALNGSWTTMISSKVSIRKLATRRQNPPNDCESPSVEFSAGKYGSIPGIASMGDVAAPHVPQNL